MRLDKKLVLRWFLTRSLDIGRLMQRRVSADGGRPVPPVNDGIRVLVPLQDGTPGPSLAPGAAPIADQPDRAVLARRQTPPPDGFVLLSLDRTDLHRAFRTHDLRLVPASAIARRIPLESPSAASLVSLCRWLSSELQRPGSVLRKRSPFSASLERAMIALSMELLADGCDGAIKAAQDLAEPHVRKIEAWIDAHLDREISTDDLAAIVGTPSRSVRAAFRRFRDCTPMQAVQRRRLEHARRRLEAPKPDTSVTSVALDCGFSHLGRFSIAFHALFGEKPSQTLARARAEQQPRPLGRRSAAG